MDFDDVPVVMLQVGADGHIERATGAGVARHGGARAFEGRILTDIVGQEPRITAFMASCEPGMTVHTQAPVLGVPSVIWLYARTVGVVLMATESTGRWPPAAGANQAQRLQSLGRLAGGIAHDFNNVLMAVMGHAQIIQRRTRDHAIRAAAETIVTAAERAAGLTDQLLGFARQGKVRQEPAVVDELVTEVCRLLDRTIDRRIRVVHRPSSVPAVVRGDPGQLQQVILNLALNARDAMVGGGELVFATEIVEAEPTSAEVTSDLMVETRVRLSVTDTGAGMTDDVRHRVFEPYFTTKDVGEGHGLGLSMVYGIVRNHEGWIRVHSQPGAGSTFEVYLPLDRQTLLDRPGRPSEPSPGRGHVLLVDDEAMVREAVRGLLERLGYRVTEAENGTAALGLFETSAHLFDVVLMDLRMPGMSGPDCLRRLRANAPRLGAILSSGYLPSQAVQDSLASGPTEFLKKPYAIAQLAEVLQRVLQRRAREGETTTRFVK